MKKILPFLLPAMLLLVAQCTTPDDTDPKSVTDLVKTSTYNDGTYSITTEYTYNNNGTIKKIEFTNGTWMEYNYSNRLVTEDTYSSTGGITETTYYYLNNQGRADSSRETSLGVFSLYTYDNKGHMIEHKRYNNSGGLLSTYTHTYTGNNPTSIVWRDGLGNITVDQDLTYITDKLNTMGNRNLGQAFRGVSNANLVLHLDQVTNVNYAEDYTYTYDTRGRIESMTRTATGVQVIQSFSYI